MDLRRAMKRAPKSKRKFETGEASKLRPYSQLRLCVFVVVRRALDSARGFVGGALGGFASFVRGVADGGASLLKLLACLGRGLFGVRLCLVLFGRRACGHA
jgi:hypothetical protein